MFQVDSQRVLLYVVKQKKKKKKQFVKKLNFSLLELYFVAMLCRGIEEDVRSVDT